MPLPTPDAAGSRPFTTNGPPSSGTRRRRAASSETYLVSGFLIEAYGSMTDVPFASTRAATPPKTSSQERPDALYGRCRTCMTAGSEGTPMLLCERCDRAFHLTCLHPPLAEAPKGEWVCARCTRTGLFASHMRATAAVSAVAAAEAAAAPAPPHRVRHKALGLSARVREGPRPLRKRGRGRTPVAIDVREAIAVGRRVQRAVAQARKKGTEVDDGPLVRALAEATRKADEYEKAKEVTGRRRRRRRARVEVVRLVGVELPKREPLPGVVARPPRKRFMRPGGGQIAGEAVTMEANGARKSEARTAVKRVVDEGAGGGTNTKRRKVGDITEMLPIKKKLLRLTANYPKHPPANGIVPPAPPVRFASTAPAPTTGPLIAPKPNDPRPRIPTGAKRAEIVQLRSRRLAAEAASEAASVRAAGEAARKKTDASRNKFAGERIRARADERRKRPRALKPAGDGRREPPPVQAGIAAVSGTYAPEAGGRPARVPASVPASVFLQGGMMQNAMQTALQTPMQGAPTMQNAPRAPQTVLMQAQVRQVTAPETEPRAHAAGQYAMPNGVYGGREVAQAHAQASAWRAPAPAISQYAPPPAAQAAGVYRAHYAAQAGSAVPQVPAREVSHDPLHASIPAATSTADPYRIPSMPQPAMSAPITHVPVSQAPIPAMPGAPRVPVPDIPPPAAPASLPFIAHLGRPSPTQASLPSIGRRLGQQPLPSFGAALQSQPRLVAPIQTPVPFALPPQHHHHQPQRVPQYYTQPAAYAPARAYGQTLPGTAALVTPASSAMSASGGGGGAPGGGGKA